MRIYNPETGVKRTFQFVKKIEKTSHERPILVAVYGLPYSRKSYVIGKLHELLLAEGYFSVTREGSAREHVFETIKHDKEHLAEHLQARWVIQFHQGVQRHPLEVEDIFVKSGYVSGDDPNILSARTLGRKMDLNFGVFNPHCCRFYNPSLYDLVISNPDAIEKKLSLQIRY